MLQLRNYQQELDDLIHQAWSSGCQNVLAVSATGSGKTVLMSHIVHQHQGVVFVIAHRHELVSQISTTVAKAGVKHNIIASKNSVRDTVKAHVREVGSSYFNPNARVVVASVETLRSRKDKIAGLMEQCTLWLIDEAHHVQQDNTWGKVTKLLPNAKGLGVTATPTRSDGKGLGSHVTGVFDNMVVGKSMRWLIDNGYLCDYRIFCPPNDLDLNPVRVSKTTGEYNPNDLQEAIGKSHIVGDVVEQYLKIARGKQGITFATDVRTATVLAEKFVAAGVKAAVVHGKTPDAERSSLLMQFRNREIQQLVNVDLFGEGFDVPGIEVVSMARPTQSFGLYSQQFGRALRIMDGKSHAIIIDHVGNVIRHGLPDAEIEWTLDARDKRKSSKTIDDKVPMSVCTNPTCVAPYPKILKACPFCGSVNPPTERSEPKFVDGDLTELDPSALAKLRGEIARVDQPAEQVVSRMKYAGAPPNVAMAAGRKHLERQEAIHGLRDSMAYFSGLMRDRREYTNDMIYKKFYFTFGTDMATAMTLSKKDALELQERVNTYVTRNT